MKTRAKTKQTLNRVTKNDLAILTLRHNQEITNLDVKIIELKKELTMGDRRVSRLEYELEHADNEIEFLKEENLRLEKLESSKFSTGEVLGFVLLTIVTFMMVLLHV